MSDDTKKDSEKESPEKDKAIDLPESNDGESATFSEENEDIELPKPNDGEIVTKGG